MEQMEQEKYNKLIEDVKYKVYDLVNRITDDYIEGFVESVDCEIKNIKENRDFYQNLYYKYEYVFSLACEIILKLQGYSKEVDDFYLEKLVELKNEILEKAEKRGNYLC